MHLFLSPHPDDAALSCGGQIAQLTRAGEEVLIYTLMAGDPPEDAPQTDFVRELHERWKLPGAQSAAQVARARREEDMAAARALGAALSFGAYPDAPYRVDPASMTVLYPDWKAALGAVHPADPARSAGLNGYWHISAHDVVHAPLGVGGHVDHQLVRDMALRLTRQYAKARVYFYEEFPYTRGGKEAVRAALVAFNQPLMSIPRPFDNEALEAKIAAIACYQSQISSFWPNQEAMAEELRARSGPSAVEREWRLLYGA
jgi:LmbE family N-acetylglucosaminyl deacetylase